MAHGDTEKWTGQRLTGEGSGTGDQECSEGNAETAESWVSLGCGKDTQCADCGTSETSSNTSNKGGSVSIVSLIDFHSIQQCSILVVLLLFFLGEDLHGRVGRLSL